MTHTNVYVWLAPMNVYSPFLTGGRATEDCLASARRPMGHSRWRTPTTHILKPPVSELAEFAEIEHFCLRLANEVGLPVATSAVMRVADEIAFVTSVSTAC